jgi:hypothetical protein
MAKRVLVACEYSGVVRDAFRKRGFDSWSCDIEPTESDPTYHYQCDVTEILDIGWDLIIAHPPCTHLSSSGARWFEQKRKDGRQQQGIDFFMLFTTCKCENVAIENPVGIMSTFYRTPDQIINPYEFGDPFEKRTCLWLKGLPLLKPTNMIEPPPRQVMSSGKTMPFWYSNCGGNRAKARSKTFQGIADAMAQQWGDYITKSEA